MRATIIGIDCATRANKVGLALGTFFEGRTAVDQVRLGAPKDPPSDIVAEWVKQNGGPVLLALDAPLGWPAPLAQALSRHRAGAELPYDPHQTFRSEDELRQRADLLFRRETDHYVFERTGKRSLDIGADRIARTAHAALALLEELRRRLVKRIPLAWTPEICGVSAIEVYPAATLKAHGIPYNPDSVEERQRLCDALRTRIGMPTDSGLIQRSRDALDAVTCLLAGHDFLNGQARCPEKPALAEQEGWIWVRDPSLVRELEDRP
jgi:hypothetical protein